MKEVDENFFVQDGKPGRQAKDFLKKGEKILWKGIPKKEIHIIERLKASNVSVYTPLLFILDAIVAILVCSWLAPIGGNIIWFLLLMVAGMHFISVGTWIRVRNKAKKSVYETEYVITNRRVFELRGKIKYVNFSIEYNNIKNIRYRQTDLDKKYKAADIFITTLNESRYIMYDIPNGLFIFEKLDTLYQMKVEEAEEFYAFGHVCEHCKSYYDAKETRCPSCGAPREG